MNDSTKRILGLYEQFIKQSIEENPDYEWLFSSIYARTNQFFSENEANLEIDLPISEIEDIFYKTGVIILRKPEQDKLLIGCGNAPLTQIYDYRTGEGEHEHKDSDTVNIDISANPTIIAFFGRGNQSLAQGLAAMKKGKYHILGFEAIHPFANNLEEMNSYDFSFMDKDYKLVDQRGYEEEPTSLEKQTFDYMMKSSRYDEELDARQNNLSSALFQKARGETHYIDNVSHFSLFPNFEKTNAEIKQIIAKDDLDSFIKYYPAFSALRDVKIDDKIPVVIYAFNESAWKIFQYAILRNANQNIIYEDSTISKQIKKMIDEDRVDSFKAIFKNDILFNKISIDNDLLYKYIDLYSRDNIRDYVINTLKTKSITKP